MQITKDNKWQICKNNINVVSHLSENDLANYKVWMNGDLNAIMCWNI